MNLCVLGGIRRVAFTHANLKVEIRLVLICELYKKTS